MSEAGVRLAPERLCDLITRALVAAGTREEAAASVARSLTQAEIDGQKGHGLSRVPSYVAQVRSGKVNGQAEANMQRPRPAALRIDAAHGFAYPAIDLAITTLPGLAATAGVAVAAITRSHHFGVAGQVVERLADHGLAALVVGNTPAAMPAWGGRAPLFGTNPLAFAAPQRGAAPLVIDLALTQVARAKVVAAAKRGETIPADWALDANGQPTTDPAAALKGTMRPLGGAKGAALALMVEVLAAAVTGSRFSSEATSFFEASGGPSGVGQLIVAIDPAAFGPPDHFLDRMALLAQAITAEPGVRLPGARRLALRAACEADGVAVDAALLAEVEALTA